MAIKAKGCYVRISDQIWDREAVVTMSKGARWGYVAAIAWSKSHGMDGTITPFGLRRCEIEPSEITEMEKAELLVPDNDEKGNYLIVNYDEWQTTKAEVEIVKETKRQAGKARAAKAAAGTVQ